MRAWRQLTARLLANALIAGFPRISTVPSPDFTWAPIADSCSHLTTSRGIKPCRETDDVGEMIELACVTARERGFGCSGEATAIAAGMPFGTPGTTNLLRIAEIQ